MLRRPRLRISVRPSDAWQGLARLIELNSSSRGRKNTKKWRTKTTSIWMTKYCVTKNMLSPCETKEINTQSACLQSPFFDAVSRYTFQSQSSSIPSPLSIICLDCSHGASHLNRILVYCSDFHRALGDALVVHATTSRLSNSRTAYTSIDCS